MPGPLSGLVHTHWKRRCEQNVGPTPLGVHSEPRERRPRLLGRQSQAATRWASSAIGTIFTATWLVTTA
jgi:hypothetical protein